MSALATQCNKIKVYPIIFWPYLYIVVRNVIYAYFIRSSYFKILQLCYAVKTKKKFYTFLNNN